MYEMRGVKSNVIDMVRGTLRQTQDRLRDEVRGLKLDSLELVLELGF